jgi:biotin transport system substrate-specific component
MSLALPVLRSTAPVLAVKALGLSLVIAASAHISVPFWPVPMTLQTLAVLGIAGVFGARVGVAATLAYLAEGALGLPVFAHGGGLAIMMGPTAGYLLAMPLEAAIVGKARGPLQRAGAILLASAVCYALGAAWLAQFVGAEKAIALGVTPFLLGDAAKAVLAWAIAGVARSNRA